MRITDSNISMYSSHYYSEKTEISEKFKMWVGNERPIENEPRGLALGHLKQKPKLDTFELSKDAVTKANDITETQVKDDPFEMSPQAKMKSEIIERLIYALTGKRIKIETIDETAACAGKKCPKETGVAAEGQAEGSQPARPEGPQRAGWGVEYDYHEFHYEAEKTTFSAQGTVRTADGKEISFDVDMSMSREFMEHYDVQFRAGDAVKKVDPLVVNFEGTAAQLTETKFEFDLNVDGTLDKISFTGPSSGMLAIDTNADGVINDGSELFGPTTGNGFAELAQYDEDGNNWIDEADSAYDKLRLWVKDAQGADFIYTLAEKNVGAIYLGSQSTPYSIKDSTNQLQGQVTASGVYLAETGQVGTIQQVDLAA